MLTDWLRHLFTPHCQHCAHDKECKTCDTLKDMLESERFEKRQLLNRIVELTAPKVVEQREQAPRSEPIEIKSNRVPWKIKQHMLEEEDRAKARILREQQQVKDLEKELLGAENG